MEAWYTTICLRPAYRQKPPLLLQMLHFHIIYAAITNSCHRQNKSRQSYSQVNPVLGNNQFLQIMVLGSTDWHMTWEKLKVINPYRLKPKKEAVLLFYKSVKLFWLQQIQ